MNKLSRLAVVAGFAFLLGLGARAADVYDPATQQLTISQVSALGSTYSNVVITVGSILSAKGGTAPTGPDIYTSANNQLAIPAVYVNTTLYTNVVITVGNVLRDRKSTRLNSSHT